MLHFSSVKNTPVTFKKLSDCPEHTPLVATWFTDEWGYLYDQARTREEAIAFRINSMPKRGDRIYLAFFGKQPVGMFSLEPKEFDIEIQRKTKVPSTCEIYFIYVDKIYRGLRVGHQLIQEIKRCAQVDMNAELIILDTLKPKLNLMYKKAGAELICDNYFGNEPTDVLSISLGGKNGFYSAGVEIESPAAGSPYESGQASP